MSPTAIMVAIVVVLVLLGVVLAMAETSLSRMNRVRAMALREEGRRNAALLERMEKDPARFLNSIYLAVMLVQNGSVTLVAIAADRAFGKVWVTVASAAFTLAYFVVVEAMSKTFGILHSDRVALALAPVAYFLSRVLSLPTRMLIGLANVLLPGRGLKQGPFVSEEEIRQMAEAGHEAGAIEEEEKEMIHSIFEFGDTVVREVMTARPDMVTAEAGTAPEKVLELMLKQGVSRMPVYDESGDNIVGLVYAKDIMRRLRNGTRKPRLKDMLRPAGFVPESKKVAELLREMQQSKTHMAIVVDEYGDVAGLVTLEDLLEEIVGEIHDEYDRPEPEVERVDQRTVRVHGRLSTHDLSDLLGVELPDTEWDTVGGLMAGLLGKLPKRGEEVGFEGLTFRAEAVKNRRITKVLITRTDEATAKPRPEASPDERAHG